MVWYAPHDLEWTEGNYVVAGSETHSSGDWMAVWGWHPEHRSETEAGRCIIMTLQASVEEDTSQHAYDYGYGAWGP